MIGLLAAMGGCGIPGIGGIMSANGDDVDGGSDGGGRKVEGLVVGGSGNDGRAVAPSPPPWVDGRGAADLDCGAAEIVEEWRVPAPEEDGRAAAPMGAAELAAFTDLRIFWRAFGSASRLPKRSIPPAGGNDESEDEDAGNVGGNDGNGSDPTGGDDKDDDSIDVWLGRERST